MAIVLPGNSERLENKFLYIVKLDSSKKDFLYCQEEIEMYNYQGLLLGLNKKGLFEIIYSGPARGHLEDFNGDGLLDFIKNGGIGEPVSSTAGAYDPYLVFKQTRKKSKIDFQIDDELSEKLSLSKNFKWHGSKYDSSIVVEKNGEVQKP